MVVSQEMVNREVVAKTTSILIFNRLWINSSMVDQVKDQIHQLDHQVSPAHHQVNLESHPVHLEEEGEGEARPAS